MSPMAVAVSAGEKVIVVDAATHASVSFDTGPVGWLYPAPSGTLFAPDLMHGRTAVIDVGAIEVRQRLDGVTTPRFTSLADKYLVAGRDVLVVSYPDRALLETIPAGLESPWQTLVTPDDTAFLILDRRPDGKRATLVAVDLIYSRVVLRRRLPGDVVHFALDARAGLALAARDKDRVMLVDPATAVIRFEIPVDGFPADVGFTHGGRILIAAVAEPDGGGHLLLQSIRINRKGLKLKKSRRVALHGSPVRLAVDPTGERIAVVSSPGALQIINVDDDEPTATILLEDPPRDVVWCDPAFSGPSVAEWSDRNPDDPQLSLVETPTPTP